MAETNTIALPADLRLKSPDFLQIVSEPILIELAHILEQKFHKLPDFIAV